MSMRTVLHDRGGKIHISVFNQKDIVDAVTAKIYRIDGNPEDGLFIMPANDRFNVPERKFGRHREHLAILTNDYDRVGPSVGAMMVGLKGSGKSMLAEDTCNWAIAKGLPVFLVENAVPVSWLEMVSAAVGPAVFYFDEFGKAYRKTEDVDQREALLGFFSSSTRMGSLYLVTGNVEEEFSDFMLDRPGRFRYRFRFAQPQGEELSEVLRHHHVDESLWPMIQAYCRMHPVGYDVLNNVLPVIRNCKTPEEVYAKSEIYNIPTFPNYGVTGLTTLRARFDVQGEEDVRVRMGTSNGDLSTIAYHIAYENPEKKGSYTSHHRTVQLADIQDYQVPVDVDFHGSDTTVAYEFPDAGGEMMLLTLGWSFASSSNITAVDREFSFKRQERSLQRKGELSDGQPETIEHPLGRSQDWSSPQAYLASKHHL